MHRKKKECIKIPEYEEDKIQVSCIDMLFMKVKDTNELFKVTFTSIFLKLLLISVNHHFCLP